MVYPGVRSVGRLFSTGVGRRELGVKEERDEVLVWRVAESGDERAFSELYDRYVSLVYSAGMRYLRDQAHAEDLVQEVFLSVWRGAASFDVYKAGFATWIYCITRNRATDQVRRRRSRVRTVGSDLPLEPEEADPTGDLSRSFDIVAALSRLAPISPGSPDPGLHGGTHPARDLPQNRYAAWNRKEPHHRRPPRPSQEHADHIRTS